MNQRSALSPECRLVFRSADPACKPAEFAELVASVRDWPRVLLLAEREAAASVLWRALRETGVALPPAVESHLSRRASAIDLRQQYLSRRLEQTAQVLTERDVPFLLLKGAAVGALVDPTFRVRPMTDIDLIVRREDTVRARAAVIAAGWPETTDPVLLELLRDAHHLPHFVDPRIPDIRLELHVALLPADQPFAFSESDLWRDARMAGAPFSGARIPSMEHLTLHAAVHFAWQHMMTFGAWRTFRTVALLSTREGFLWSRLAEVARAAHASTSCYWTLRLAQQMSGLAVPPETMHALKPPTPGWVRAALARHFVAGIAFGEGQTSPSVSLTRALWRAAVRPKWSGHPAPVRRDPEQRWQRARGTVNNETLPERFARHVASYRAWWGFFSGTLFR